MMLLFILFDRVINLLFRGLLFWLRLCFGFAMLWLLFFRLFGCNNFVYYFINLGFILTFWLYWLFDYTRGSYVLLIFLCRFRSLSRWLLCLLHNSDIVIDDTWFLVTALHSWVRLLAQNFFNSLNNILFFVNICFVFSIFISSYGLSLLDFFRCLWSLKFDKHFIKINMNKSNNKTSPFIIGILSISIYSYLGFVFFI